MSKSTKSALLKPAFCPHCGACRDLLWERLGAPDSLIARAMIAAVFGCTLCHKDILDRLTRLAKANGLSTAATEANMRRRIELLDAQIAQREK